MNSVEKKIYNLNPRYLSEYENLLKRFAQFGGGADDERYIQGRSFSNVYEFYIYAFFIGLYKNEFLDLTENDSYKTFWEVKNWQPKELVDALLACAIAKSDFSMNDIEVMQESDLGAEITKLKTTIESYANGGFRYINNKIEIEPDEAEQDDFFIKMLAQ